MTKKRALITGVGGQDGSYLTEHLLEKDYEVYGIIRRHSVSENQDSRIKNISQKINTFYGDLLDIPSLSSAKATALLKSVMLNGYLAQFMLTYPYPFLKVFTTSTFSVSIRVSRKVGSICWSITSISLSCNARTCWSSCVITSKTILSTYGPVL